jgi:hypothetical protein
MLTTKKKVEAFNEAWVSWAKQLTYHKIFGEYTCQFQAEGSAAIYSQIMELTNQALD